MPGEKVNNWKNKLDQLQSSDGDVFNKETSWNKLHQRLEPDKKNKKLIWYWVAAACLLFALFTPLLLSNKKENALVKNNVAQEKKINPLVLVPSVTNDSVKMVAVFSNKKRKAANSIGNNQIISNAEKGNIIKPEVMQSIKNKNELAPQQTVNTAVTPVDTAIALVATEPAAKQLKIFHINELGNVPVQNNYGHYNEYASSPLHLMNPVYDNAPQQVKTGFKIFTIKNISTN